MVQEKSEINNIDNNKRTAENKMQCPICGTRMKLSGKLEFTNPKTGRKRMVQVHVCGRCGYRSLG
jgi:C4-type Zn-finger protein